MTYDLQTGMQSVWRRAVSSNTMSLWHPASQACSELSVPTVSRRSCAVFLTAFRSTPKAAQREEVLQEILHSVLQNIYVHAKGCAKRRSVTRDPAQCSSKHSRPCQRLRKKKKCYKRSCTVFFATFRSMPKATQREEVLQEILHSVLQNIHVRAKVRTKRKKAVYRTLR